MRCLVAIPVYNEAAHIRHVLSLIREHTSDILVIDDGSTDATPRILGETTDINMIRHARNRGYGRSIRDAFRFAAAEKYDWVITIDCDEQHEPEQLPEFLARAAKNDLDIVSGSRYMPASPNGTFVPVERRKINHTITQEINQRLGLSLTDSFCGYKAHRVSAMRRLRLSDSGYAFPMQLWVQAVAADLRIGELPTALIYNDPNRTFGATLDNPAVRLAHYRHVLNREIRRCRSRLPMSALAGAGLLDCIDCSCH